VQNGRLEKPIILWNRTFATATEHAARLGHAEAVPTPEDAVARADVVWSCLSGQQAVLECFEKILAGDVRGKLFVECSTITPEATDKLAKQVLDKGGEFVAMPGMCTLSLDRSRRVGRETESNVCESDSVR